jgi:hypothetical protein
MAPVWAELDLLASAFRHNLQAQRDQAVDPNAAARKQSIALFREFEGLLTGLEDPVQDFLKKHPEILSPTHTRMWPKLPIGARSTDFVFREPPKDYLLVEIEAPIRSLFRKDGQPHQELVHAINQVTDWLRYIEDNVSTVRGELGLHGISVQPRSLIVIGRSKDLTSDDRRKLTTLQNMVPKLQILTYDDLLATARASAENLLGPLWDLPSGTEVFYAPRR